MSLVDAGNAGVGTKRQAGRHQRWREERGTVALMISLVDGDVQEAVGHVVVETSGPVEVKELVSKFNDY